ncbi:hypothetical protein INR49_027883, partial [Caranx melampygus]
MHAETGDIGKNWKVRKFILRDDPAYMHYYDPSKGDEPLGSIHLRGSVVTAVEYVPDAKKYDIDGNLFEIITSDEFTTSSRLLRVKKKGVDQSHTGSVKKHMLSVTMRLSRFGVQILDPNADSSQDPDQDHHCLAATTQPLPNLLRLETRDILEPELAGDPDITHRHDDDRPNKFHSKNKQEVGPVVGLLVHRPDLGTEDFVSGWDAATLR